MKQMWTVAMITPVEEPVDSYLFNCDSIEAKSALDALHELENRIEGLAIRWCSVPTTEAFDEKLEDLAGQMGSARSSEAVYMAFEDAAKQFPGYVGP